jgi:hypothetical protein
VFQERPAPTQVNRNLRIARAFTLQVSQPWKVENFARSRMNPRGY